MRVSSRWWALVLAALFTFSLQSFVTQTHLHLEAVGAPGSTFVQTGDDHRGHHDSSPDSQDDCPLCHAADQAGHYLLPTAFAFDAPLPAPLWRAPVALVGKADGQKSHAWRSRGPPTTLHA